MIQHCQGNRGRKNRKNDILFTNTKRKEAAKTTELWYEMKLQGRQSFFLNSYDFNLIWSDFDIIRMQVLFPVN